MTSASELFSGRRCRRHNGVTIDSYLADAIFSSSSSHQHRSAINRHSQHYSSLSNRCVSNFRRIHRRRIDLQEHHPEESGSIVNSDNQRSIRTGNNNNNNRLPGSVLLARERLVERLRGVSVSGNRQSSGPSSTTATTNRRNDFSTLNVLETRRNSPLGLNEDEVKCLRLEAFNSESCSVSMECTICLEGFRDGDEIVCLLCTHRFHSCCLFPWVRVCGACPNCRKRVLVNLPVKQCSAPLLQAAMPVRVIESLSVEGKRGRGRPKLTWEERIRLDLMELHLSEDMVHDRSEWRHRIKAKDF